MAAKAYVYIATSLDGFIARKNGDLDWLSKVEVPGEDYGYQKFMDSVDALVMGRKTYEKVLSFGDWPYADKDVVVLSSSESIVDNNLKGKVTIKSCSPNDLIQWATTKGYEKIYIDGGRTISNFLNAGLIEEIAISKIPVLIGEGIPLFTGIDSDIELHHLETIAYSSGLVQSIYRVNYAEE